MAHWSLPETLNLKDVGEGPSPSQWRETGASCSFLGTSDENPAFPRGPSHLSVLVQGCMIWRGPLPGPALQMNCETLVMDVK